MGADTKRRPDPAVGIGVAGALAFGGLLFVLPEPPPAATPGAALPSGSFAVVDALVFDGEAFRASADVWVDDGRIREVGPELVLPEALPRVDGRGHTLLPGLIDAHVHVTGPGARADALRFGVTTLLDQFTHPGVLEEARKAREQIREDPQADLFSAGYLATAPGGHGTEYGLEVPTLTAPEQAAEWVRSRIAEGSDWIKIVSEDGSTFGARFPTLEPAIVAALVEAAHAEGRKAVVHVSRLRDALAAVDAGADGLVHVWRDERIDEGSAELFARSGLFVTPTLAVNTSLSGGGEHLALLDRPGLSAAQRSSLGGSFRHPSTLDPEPSFDSVGRLHAAGVSILAGTDAPNPGTAFGISLHHELQLLQRAGLTAREVLAAATSVPAQAYGLEDRGRLEPGRLADLVLVEGDPRDSLSSTLEIVGVWKDGFPVVREATTGDAPSGAPSVLGVFDEGSEGWSTTTDAMMGGASVAEVGTEDGALVVRGEVRAGFGFPWAGAAPGLGPGGGADLSAREELRFRTRGDGREYRVMLIAAGSPGPPPSVPFASGAAWSEVEIPLSDFGADLTSAQALAFVAGNPAGSFRFELDDVELR